MARGRPVARICAQEEKPDRKEEQMARDRLRNARLDSGMTQQQVADHLGITLRYYQSIEKGDRTGDFQLWDELEDLFSIHQRDLRLITRRDSP